jgi:hypothetical protein
VLPGVGELTRGTPSPRAGLHACQACAQKAGACLYGGALNTFKEQSRQNVTVLVSNQNPYVLGGAQWLHQPVGSAHQGPSTPHGCTTTTAKNLCSVTEQHRDCKIRMCIAIIERAADSASGGSLAVPHTMTYQNY